MKPLITYGTRQMNALLDSTLMDKYKFPSQTLMELAGLAIAQVTHNNITNKNLKSKICVLVGPGNNGGDGLVAARHLKMMQYQNVEIVMFKKLPSESKNGRYHELCLLNGIDSKNIQDFIKVKNEGDNKGEDKQEPQVEEFEKYLSEKDLLIDGIFGFPFQGDIRNPYGYFIPSLSKFEDRIFSIDIPSGWDANDGNIKNLFTPKYLISLGMPKKCSEDFKGEHYFGGRFVPKSVEKELNVVLPEFKGDQLYCRL